MRILSLPLDGQSIQPSLKILLLNLTPLRVSLLNEGESLSTQCVTNLNLENEGSVDPAQSQNLHEETRERLRILI